MVALILIEYGPLFYLFLLMDPSYFAGSLPEQLLSTFSSNCNFLPILHYAYIASFLIQTKLLRQMRIGLVTSYILSVFSDFIVYALILRQPPGLFKDVSVQYILCSSFLLRTSFLSQPGY